MTLEQKAKAYDEAIERARIWKEKSGMPIDKQGILDDIFPELKKSEGEESKKWILEYLHDGLRKSDEQFKDHFRTAIAWLEKQGKCEADCPQNHQDVNHPNGCIAMEDFNGGEGFYKLNIEYLNKRQVEEIEEIVRTWNKDVDCGLCTSKEHCISIEKQDTIKDGNSIDPHFGKPITTAETKTPKFKVGDKVLWKYDKSDVRTIAKISDYGTYWIEYPGCGSGWWTDDELEPYVESDWTEEDEIKRDLVYKALNNTYDIKQSASLSSWLNKRIGHIHKQGKLTDEDTKMIDILCCIFEVSNTYYKVDRQGQYAISSKEILNWLNSIKQRLQ